MRCPRVLTGLLVTCTCSHMHELKSSKMACQVETVAGNLKAGYTDDHMHGREAYFSNPSEMCMLADRSLLVADSGNHCIRMIDAYGIVSTYAGTPRRQGSRNGPRDKAQFNNPVGLCTISDGSVIVADRLNNCIRKIDTNGITSTLAGLSRTEIIQPVSVCSATDGEEEFLYVCDRSGLWRLTLTTRAHSITTLVVKSSSSWPEGQDLYQASLSELHICNPVQLCQSFINGESVTFLADQNIKTVSMISRDQVTTVTSKSWSGLEKRICDSLGRVTGIAVDNWGYIYMLSTVYNFITIMSPRRIGCLLAGSSERRSGMTDGIATEATFENPSRLLYDPVTHCLYVSQTHCIRRVILPMTARISEQPWLVKRLENITDIGQGTDVTFKVDGQQVHAISALLCENSDYFKSMFASQMKESKAMRAKMPIAVKDTSFNALKAVVMWVMFEVMILHGDTPVPVVMNTLRLSDRYLLKRLKEKCAAILMRQIDENNTFEILRLSEETDITFLKAECIAFIGKNLKQMRTNFKPEFEHLSLDITKILLRQVKAD